jgi:hypothetical protein
MGVYYTTYKIDSEALLNIYIGVMKSILYQSIDEVIKFVPFWTRYQGTMIYESSNGQGKVEWIVSTDNARAFADEYGTGQYMEDNNPYLNEYKSSELWNPWREGKKIVTREYGEYPSFNWETGKRETKFSQSMVPGVKTAFRGNMPRKHISSMIEGIEQTFLYSIGSEGMAQIKMLAYQNFDRIFVKEIHKL